MICPEILLLAANESSFQVITYFNQANTAGKGIIIVLGVLSLWAWSAMIGKYVQLRNWYRVNRAFERYFNDLPTVLTLYDPRPYYSYGPFGALFAEAIKAYHQTDFAGSGGMAVAQARIGMVENALQRGVAYRTHDYEDKMILLASIVTGAPFIGLLGTAWGVMDAFGAVALKSSATLQTLAPGVSGSLLTTVAALLVAIPSAFGYNFLLSMLKRNITELENFASTVADRFDREHQLSE